MITLPHIARFIEKGWHLEVCLSRHTEYKYFASVIRKNDSHNYMGVSPEDAMVRLNDFLSEETP